MTLEQGKPLAEARGETMAAADIIDWFADEGFRVYGRIVPPPLQPRDPPDGDQGPGRARSPRSRPGTSRSTRSCARSRAGAGRRLLDDRQGARGDPGRARPRSSAPSRTRACPPACSALVYGDPAEISGHLIPHPIDPQDHLHRVDAGRQAAGRAGRPAHEAGVDGARRPRPGDRVRRRRPRAGGQDRSAPPSSATQARCASPPPASSSTAPSPRTSARRWPRVADGLTVGDGLSRGHPDGPAGQPPAARRHAGPRRGRRAARRHGAGRRTPHRRHRQLLGPHRLRERARWTPGCSTRSPSARWPAIREFDHLDEAITEANRLSFGLAGYAFTRSLANADLLTRRVEVGMLWVNMPAMPSAECPSAASRTPATAPKAAPRRWSATSTRARSASCRPDRQGFRRRGPAGPGRARRRHARRWRRHRPCRRSRGSGRGIRAARWARPPPPAPRRRRGSGRAAGRGARCR